MAYLSAELQLRFLSTLSLRRATLYVIIVSLSDNDFYPRSPCGERPYCIITKSCYNNFYPRSPCGERHVALCGYERAAGFLSTLSLRRATKIRLHPYGPGIISIHALLAESDRSLSCVYLSCRISIHALLAESDPTQPSRPCWTTHFYPRSPCGERHPKMTDHPHNTNFYPRSPCGERHRRK